MNSSKLSLCCLIISIAIANPINCSSSSSQPHHRVRRFALSKNSKISFDVQLQMPIPSLGGVDVDAIVDFPLTVTMLNDTYLFTPMNMPHFNVPPIPLSYPQFLPNYYSYDSFFGSGKPSYVHLMKRSLGAAASQHRYDLFNSISDVFDRYGIDGRACILKSICQLGHTPLLIETPLHEIVEHILTISRSFDEDGILTEFIDAENFGKNGGKCEEKFSSCWFSLFESINLTD